MKRRWFAALLALIMALSLMPAAALAAEEKDDAAAAVPDEAKFTLQLKGQRYDPSRNDSSGFSYIAGCYVNMPFTCGRCLEDPDHPSRHTVLAGEVKSRFHEMQSKVEQIAGANMLVIGLTQEYEFEGTPLAVHTFNEYDDSDPIEVVPFLTAKTKQLFFVAIPYSGQVDVACVSEAAHEKRTYELTGDSIMSAAAEKRDGTFVCRMTVDKTPYIEKYNADTGGGHMDAAPEEKRIELELTFDRDCYSWTADNAEISVKCAPDQVSFDLDDIGGGVHAINKTLTGNYPEKFAESFQVTVTPDKENPAPSMSAESLTGTASVSADIGYQEVPFRFAEPAVEQSAAEVPAAGQLTFRKEGTYRYSVQEMKGGSACTSYDETAYTLSIEVVREGNALTVADWRFDGADECTPLTITNSYRDIPYIPTPTPAPQPAKPALNTADHYAYLMGYPDGTVRPGGSITRAEATTIFFRLLTEESRSQFWATENRYSDVSAGQWYNNAVSTMTRAGIVNGYPDGTFRPNAPITRAEMAKIIALFAKLEPSAERFPDTAGHWAEPYIRLAAGSGWIEGYPDSTFRPDRAITRAETVTMIDRVLERVPKDESRLLPHETMLTFPDCRPGQWFYIAVQEAANSHVYERAANERSGDEQWKELRDNRDWTRLEH